MGEKLLIVDDDADLRKTVSVLFVREYRVFEAPDGPSALELVRHERPRLMILDLTMPGMDGIQVLEAALAIDSHLSVLMLTSETDLAMARRALERGACAYITKPFQIERLRSEVLRLLEPERPERREPYRPWRVE